MDEIHFNKSVMLPIYHNNEAMADWIVEVLWSKNLVMSMNFGCHLQFRCYRHMLWPEDGGLDQRAREKSDLGGFVIRR